MSYGNKDRPSERENGTRRDGVETRKNVGWQKILKVVCHAARYRGVSYSSEAQNHFFSFLNLSVPHGQLVC